MQNSLSAGRIVKVLTDSCIDDIRLSVNNFGTVQKPVLSLLPTCTHEVSPFHPLAMRPQPFSIIALTWGGIVSVPAPWLSPDTLHRCSCIWMMGRLSSGQRPGGRPSSLGCMVVYVRYISDDNAWPNNGATFSKFYFFVYFSFLFSCLLNLFLH